MPKNGATLLFQHSTRKVRRAALSEFLDAASRRVAKGRPVTCLITTDHALRALNRKFRGKNTPTDVLSFPALAAGGKDEPLGEIAISFDRADRQAREHGHTAEEELRILILHGLLHLSGMDHESDQGEMARAEARWRARLGLPSGLIERAQRGSRS